MITTATYTDIVAGCTGAMPNLNLPKKVALAAGVRALADWIAQNALAGGVPLVPLAELYDEKIDWLLRAQQAGGQAGQGQPRAPLAARAVDLAIIPEA